MKELEIKKIHDGVLGHFGLNKSRLLGAFFNATLAAAGQGRGQVCLWPVESDNPNASGYELGIYVRSIGGPRHTSVHFNKFDIEECIKVCNGLNRRLLDLSEDDAWKIIQSSNRHTDKRRRDRLDKALAKIVSILTPEDLLAIPECRDAISRKFGETAEDVIVAYNANPEEDNLDLKFTTREVLEITLNDLESLLEWVKMNANLQEAEKRIKKIDNTIKLGRDYLEKNSSILDNII